MKTPRRHSALRGRPRHYLRVEELESREQPAGLGLSVLFGSGFNPHGLGLALGHARHEVSLKVIETPAAVRVHHVTLTVIDLHGIDTPQRLFVIPSDLLRVVEGIASPRTRITIADPAEVVDEPTTSPPVAADPVVITPELPISGGPSVDQPVANLFIPASQARTVSAVAAAVAPAATQAASSSAATPSAAAAPSLPEPAASVAATSAPTTTTATPAASVFLFSQAVNTPVAATQTPTPTSLTVLASNLGPVAARSEELAQLGERFGLVYGLDRDLVPTSTRPATTVERTISTVDPPLPLIEVAPLPHVPDTETALAPPPAVVAEAGPVADAAVPVAPPAPTTEEENAGQSGWHWAWLAAVGAVIAGGGQWIARRTRFLQRAYAALRGPFPTPMPLLPADGPRPAAGSPSYSDWDE